MLSDNYTDYSDIQSDILIACNFVNHRLYYKTSTTSELVTANSRTSSPYTFVQRLYSKPLAFPLRIPMMEYLNEYTFTYDDNDDDYVVYLSGYFMGDWTSVPVPYVDLTGSDLISDLIASSFFSLLQEDYSVSNAYLYSAQSMVGMAEEELVEMARGNINSRDDNKITGISLRT